MLKRLLAIALCVCLLICALPTSAVAEQTEPERITAQIKQVYKKILRATGKSSLNGWCGLMTSYQLYVMGITQYPMTRDGKDMYDNYMGVDVTNGGHKVKLYSARDYDLEGALNTITQCGTKNAYNLMVGFQWTNTAAGGKYGHAMLIHAILDGTVYFMEGFPTPFNMNAGTVLTCSIKEFADYYNEWTSFEGIVAFGAKDYTDYLVSSSADLFVNVTAQTHLLSLPCDEGENGCVALRPAIVGERLHAVELYESGDLYYRVDDGGAPAYIRTDATQVEKVLSEAVTGQDLVLPQTLRRGWDFDLKGAAVSENNEITLLEAVILDAEGNEVVRTAVDQVGHTANLKDLNKELKFHKLDEGGYRFVLYATLESQYAQGDQLQSVLQTVKFSETPFVIGNGETPVVEAVAEAQKDGWIWENEAWYLYQNGTPRTGWYCDNGVDYYFGEDGAAVTGWQEINGRLRLFTTHGAMRTGWVETDDGFYYMLSNGVAALGERTIDGVTYNFGQDGILQTQITE